MVFSDVLKIVKKRKVILRAAFPVIQKLKHSGVLPGCPAGA